MDYQTYRMQDEAIVAASEACGYRSACPDQIYMPDDPCADAEGNVWVLCLDGKYLRDDGYVR